MEIKSQAKIFKQKQKDPLKLSLIFLIVIILITGTLFLLNYNLGNKISILEENIIKKQNSIKELEKNKKIVVSNLYKINKTSIDKLEDYSKITTYINHLYSLQRKYNINFKGFKYDSGKIQTSVITSSDSIGIDYKKTYNFIKNYRENKNSLALFNLEPVKYIQEKQTSYNEFNITFSLKNNIKSILTNYKKNLIKQQEIIKKQEEQKQKDIEERKKALKEKIKKLKEKKENFIN